MGKSEDESWQKIARCSELLPTCIVDSICRFKPLTSLSCLRRFSLISSRCCSCCSKPRMSSSSYQQPASQPASQAFEHGLLICTYSTQTDFYLVEAFLVVLQFSFHRLSQPLFSLHLLPPTTSSRAIFLHWLFSKSPASVLHPALPKGLHGRSCMCFVPCRCRPAKRVSEPFQCP